MKYFIAGELFFIALCLFGILCDLSSIIHIARDARAALKAAEKQL